ncbi:DeoR family glycerol-3-phosphate regulon repressor [Rubricella aquisinus]|uniref:DeoR family glycerol-3-phosphate regulon repressor n=1 Tax=Rubricella aquisinus TaxID=2028108 RepID=A0A840X0D9_9RHOB|nr:DeoR/GlpR family DNA-binding transcription regulator [Rubricella aquisinus]MBB5514127.1 DeoR family glycerol-3-phosphate regulon repressor [Rubricella aquisinus]
MATSFRQREIAQIARDEGKVVVDDLAARFDVTVQTIRRDLHDMAEQGLLERVHGGAVLSSGVSNIGYQDRQTLFEAEKIAIARACAADIPEDISLFLNIGTSTEALARELLSHRNLVVVTNNMNVAQILSANKGCEIILTGGTLRRADGGLTGRMAISTIEQFKVDMAVIGCSALDGDGDLLDFDVQEVGVSQTIIRQSRKTMLIADRSKFQRSAPARIGSLSAIDTFYTDAPLPTPLARKCADWGTEVVVARASG